MVFDILPIKSGIYIVLNKFAQYLRSRFYKRDDAS